MTSEPLARRSHRVVARAEVRRRALLQHFGQMPFTTRQALAAGLTHVDLRSRSVSRVLRGVYVATPAPAHDHALRCLAALTLVGGDAWVASLDAARLLGLPAPTDDRPRVSVSEPLRGRHLRDVHLSARSPGTGKTMLPTRGFGTIPVTDAVDVLAECVPFLDFVNGVVLADAILNRAVDPLAVREHWRGTRARTGPRVRRIEKSARVGAESPMETKTRLLMVLGGFPEPVLQHEVRTQERCFRLDLAYEDLRLGIEYDGSHHHATEAQKHADIRRAEALGSIGWCSMHVVSRGIYQDPLGTLLALERLFDERGRPVRRSAAWRTHFVQRGTPGTW